MHWALSDFEKLLPEDIARDLPSAYTDQLYAFDTAREGLPFYHGKSGEVVYHALPTEWRRFSRTKLRQLCTTGLNIHWGKQLSSMNIGESEPVTLHFKDGSSDKVDLVVGADGSRSTVRQLLLGEAGRPTLSGWVICSGIVKYEIIETARSLRRAHPICSVALHDCCLVMTAGW